MAIWFLSFVERPSGQNLGVCLVDAPDFSSALDEAWNQGCNPGGEVAGHEVKPDGVTVEELGLNRLVRPLELDAKGYTKG